MDKFSGCKNGVFGKMFLFLPKTGGIDEKWRKWRLTFYPQKQVAVLLRPRKPTKMTKMAGVPQTKPPFAKNTVFATLKFPSEDFFRASTRKICLKRGPRKSHKEATNTVFLVSVCSASILQSPHSLLICTHHCQQKNQPQTPTPPPPKLTKFAAVLSYISSDI